MLSESEKKRLDELSAKRKSKRLDSKEFAEFKTLLAKNKERKKDEEKSDFHPGNDVKWWTKIPELTRDSATFKSNYVPGRPISTALNYIVPGILRVGLKTCYYPSVVATDPVNVWARDLYLKMFQKYRPASGYSASDLGITLFAAFEAVKLIAVYERIYGIINRYSVRNINMPTVEATALGLSGTDFNYLSSHLSDFRYDLNYLIRKAQRLCIPKDISFLADDISLLGYEYIDHNTPRGQIILFDLENVGVYSDTNVSTGGSIEFGTLGPGQEYELFNFSADNMCEALDTVLSALLGSDSVQRIMADLQVWFGESAMIEFMPMPEDYLVVPVVSESILHKLHNSTNMPRANDTTGATSTVRLSGWAINGLTSADETAILDGNQHIYQYNDCIVTVTSVKDSSAGTAGSASFQGTAGKALVGTNQVYGVPANVHIIDGYMEEPDYGFVIEGSLFKYTVSSYSSTAQFITSCVNWLITSYTLYAVNSTNVLNNIVGSSNAGTYAARLALVDWAPLVYQVASGAFTAVYGDLDVIIPISDTELERIQRTCFLSGIKTEVPVIKS